MTGDESALRALLVGCFAEFIARPLGEEETITTGGPFPQQAHQLCYLPEDEQLEYELRGKTWHNSLVTIVGILFPFSQRARLRRRFRPILLRVLWPNEVDYDTLLVRLLAPLWNSTHPNERSWFPEFEQFRARLTTSQKRVGCDFVTYMLDLDEPQIERSFKSDRQAIMEASAAIWSA
jgi:hypothetical protein